MCGIVAVVTDSPAKTPLINKSLSEMFRRGPDNGEEWVSRSGKVRLGHRRLAIVDLSDRGTQPMHNEDKTIWLTCNGEIYNYHDLRSRLEGIGHQFYSNSDSEVIIHAYEQWGGDCPDYLEGMFAFAIWDEKAKKLFAAVDRMGIKPLCYTEIPGEIALASDLRALLPLLPQKPDPDPKALAYVMTLGYIPSPIAIWKGAYKLKPGHKLYWSEKDGLHISQYWEPPTEIDHHGDYSAKKWEELFLTVLSEHLLSDVPLGFFLSGGLDSASIALGLSKLNISMKALTVSFPNSQMNEAPIAMAVTKHLNQNHEILPLEACDTDNLLDKVAEAYDEPMGYSALLTMYAISELAAKEFKVVLAGDGGDECFGGYKWHRAVLQNQFNIFTPLIQYLRRNIGLTGSRLIDRQLSRLYTGLGLSPLQQYARNVVARFFPEDTEYLMSPTNLHFTDEEWIQPLAEHYTPKLPLLRALQRVDLMSFCSECILPKVDRASMWHSLEVRVPFLDRRIIEWGLRKPIEPIELEQQNSKPVLRKFLQNEVPQQVFNHSKQGFSLRVRQDYDWNYASDQIENSWWVKNAFWTKNWRRVIDNGVYPKSGRLWFLLMLSKWAQKWLD